jgi:hypothetical protein
MITTLEAFRARSGAESGTGVTENDENNENQNNENEDLEMDGR